MKQILLFASFIFTFAFSIKAQTVIYSEDFEGASPTILINTSDLNGVTASENYWIINNTYTGGQFDFFCPIVGTQSITLTNTPNQPGAITNGPLSNYLHITCGQAAAQGISNCAFIAANTVCPPVESYFAKMSTNINTVGQSLKNGSHDIRGTIPNPKFSVSPWNNSTYEPDYNIKPLC